MRAISSRMFIGNDIGPLREADKRVANDPIRGGALAVVETVELCWEPPSAEDWRRVLTLIGLQFLRRLSGFDDGGYGWDGLNQRLLSAHVKLLPRLRATGA